ncbi:MAG TPA: ABC transporter permease, partial [Longimicrobiales bacterium]|nr:ABC transporter permease [Longimicrobiales bacterium]
MIRLSLLLYRWLILLYPSSFRRRWDAAMTSAFRDALEGRLLRLGRWGLAHHWARTVLDLAVNVPAEWAVLMRGGHAVEGRRHTLIGMDARGGGAIDAIRYELVHAVRGLRRAPALALTIVTGLAVGIGVVTAFFGLVDALLLRPLPYSEPEELVRLQERGPGMLMDHVSPAAYEALRTGARSLGSLGLYQDASLNLATDEWTESVSGARVGPALLRTLGVRPALGRLPGPADTFTGTETVLVLGDGLWRRRFDADPGVVGRVVTLEGEQAQIVGVMPEGFAFPGFGEVWAPFTQPRSELLATGEQVAAVARLAPGVAVELARAEVESLGRRLAAAASIPASAELRVVEGLFYRSRGLGVLPWLFLGAAGVVLLVVCSNVASLLLARGARRRSEIAVRASLGATRGRLVGGTLLEGALLAAAGGGLGLLVSRGILRIFLHHVGGSFPLWFDPVLDARVVAFAVLASAGSVLLFGVPPALEGSRL